MQPDRESLPQSEQSSLNWDDFGVKKGPKDVPKDAQIKKATKAKFKTCIKAKKKPKS